MSQKQIVILTLLACLIVGVTSFLMGQAAPTAVKQQASPSQLGRYQIVFNPNVRADCFLLDTQTGNTWIQTAITDVKGNPTIWLYRERVDNQSQFMNWYAKQTPSGDK
ncbi:MAG: hypothetical protein WA765_05135 [Candidatus Acidiferrum sp.]